MQWFAQRGYRTTGVDRSPEAIAAAAAFGDARRADIENAPWPLMLGSQVRQFNAVVVTNYLWRPLFPVIVQSLAPGGLLLYETFSQGHESVGRPSRPDFLLQPAELLSAFGNMHVVAFEDGFLINPDRFVQRIAAIAPGAPQTADGLPARYPLDFEAH
jgi:SAM-dependent methyltransferase